MSVARLVALDEGPDIPVDRPVVIVGRHPQCDARIDSIRVSRRHCCMTADQDHNEIVVRDLGSTNGIRINGQRVEMGRLRPGDELSIAHIRYRLDTGIEHERTVHDPIDVRASSVPHVTPGRLPDAPRPGTGSNPDESPLAAAVRDLLPPGIADRCRIQVILQVPPDAPGAESSRDACQHGSSP